MTPQPFTTLIVHKRPVRLPSAFAAHRLQRILPSGRGLHPMSLPRLIQLRREWADRNGTRCDSVQVPPTALQLAQAMAVARLTRADIESIDRGSEWFWPALTVLILALVVAAGAWSAIAR